MDEAIKWEFINTLTEYCEKSELEAEELWAEGGEDFVQFICECIDERIVVMLREKEALEAYASN